MRSARFGDAGKSRGARRIGLGRGLLEDGIAALHEGFEGRVLASRRSAAARKGEGGENLESVGAATHQIFEREAAGELLADGAGDFFPEARRSGSRR